MTELEAMTVRHSVRNFQDRPIPSDIQQKLLRRSRRSTGRAVSTFSL